MRLPETGCSVAGEPLTRSAFLRADAENVAAQLAAKEAPSQLRRKQVAVGRQWQRYEFTFAPARISEARRSSAKS